jgi:D-3-phosphoglycerate dehydrogenase
MNILIISPIDQEAIETLKAHHDVACRYKLSEIELEKAIEPCEVLVFRSGVEVTAQLMNCAPNLKVLIRAGSGIDNLDLEYVKQRGLRLERIPEPGGKAVAEMAFAFMLALSRNVLAAHDSMCRGEWEKYQLSGYLLNGKTLGIIGVGNIGSRVGRMGVAWNMRVIGYDKYITPDRASELAKQGIRLTNFDEVVEKANYISLHVPLNDTSRYMINGNVLSRMKRDAFLINLARGGVVDEQALYEALKTEGRLGGAALDVHEQEGKGLLSPLAGLPNVILTPHIGAATIDSQREIGERIVAIVNEVDKR